MAIVVNSLPYGPGILLVIGTLLSLAFKKVVAVAAMPFRAVGALWLAIDWEGVRGFCFAIGVVFLNVSVVVLVVITDSSYSG